MVRRAAQEAARQAGPAVSRVTGLMQSSNHDVARAHGPHGPGQGLISMNMNIA